MKDLTAFVAASAERDLPEACPERQAASARYAGGDYFRHEASPGEVAISFGSSRNGAFAAEMVANGFSGSEDVSVGKGISLRLLANPQPDILSKDLGSEFAISTAAIKKWSVGLPIQAALDSLLAIITKHKIDPDDVARVQKERPRLSGGGAAGS